MPGQPHASHSWTLVDTLTPAQWTLVYFPHFTTSNDPAEAKMYRRVATPHEISITRCALCLSGPLWTKVH